jgi:amino acid transporter
MSFCRDAFQQRTGDGRLSLTLLIIPLLGVFFCSVSTLTYISRILFAYSRDRAVPLPWLWIKVGRTVRAVRACALTMIVPHLNRSRVGLQSCLWMISIRPMHQ